MSVKMIEVKFTEEEIKLLINAIGWADSEGAYDASDNAIGLKNEVLDKLNKAVRS